MPNSNTTLVKVKFIWWWIKIIKSIIQIQHLLKLNTDAFPKLPSSFIIQIQHLLKLNIFGIAWPYKFNVIQIQHLLKLNLYHNYSFF